MKLMIHLIFAASLFAASGCSATFHSLTGGIFEDEDPRVMEIRAEYKALKEEAEGRIEAKIAELKEKIEAAREAKREELAARVAEAKEKIEEVRAVISAVRQ